MIVRTSTELMAGMSVLGAILGWFPQIAAVFGALYWIAMFVIQLPALKEAIQKLKAKKEKAP